MKWGVVIAIWVSLCCQCFLQLGIINWYELNKEVITQKYCENKGKPAMKCHGKCYLKKQLKKAESRQEEERRIVKQTDWPFFILPSLLQAGNKTAYKYINKDFPIFCQGYYYRYAAYIFHPPDVA